MSKDFHPLSIASVEQLTEDAIAVTFSAPNDLQHKFIYQQGQHLTVKMNIDGNEVRRCYSICSGVLEQRLQIAIKRIDGGVFSNYANDKFKVGMTVDVMPPQGHFFTPLFRESEKHYLFIAVGSGITPIISHIQSILAIEINAKITLLYGNKSTSTSMFDDKLSLIENKHRDRFKRLNIFSAEQQKQQIFNGRISAHKLIALDLSGAFEMLSFSDVFICGPEEMVNEIKTNLKALHFSDEHIHYELFYSDAITNKVNNKVAPPKQNNSKDESCVSVLANNIKTTLNLATNGDNILDAAIEQGADLPFSCKVGVCASCKAKLIRGKVTMDVNHSLTDEDVAQGMILTCQSHPTTDIVELDFDID